MKVCMLNYGALPEYMPKRSHNNDAGADVYSMYSFAVPPHRTVKIPLGFGVELPAGFAGYIFPRSSLSAKGIVCELPPIDAGYTGEVHAVITNNSSSSYTINKGDRIGQLVITPVVIADFITEKGEERQAGAFGSTGR